MDHYFRLVEAGIVADIAVNTLRGLVHPQNVSLRDSLVFVGLPADRADETKMELDHELVLRIARRLTHLGSVAFSVSLLSASS